MAVLVKVSDALTAQWLQDSDTASVSSDDTMRVMRRCLCYVKEVPCAGTFGRMESNTAALMKILDSLEKQERMVKTMLEDRKRQLKGKGKPQPGLQQLTASAAQVEHHTYHISSPWAGGIPAAGPTQIKRIGQSVFDGCQSPVDVVV